MLLQPKLDQNTRQMGTFPYIYHYLYSHTFLCIGFLNVCQVCAKVFTGLSQTFSILNIQRRWRGRQNGILGFKSTVRTGFTQPVDGLWVHILWIQKEDKSNYRSQNLSRNTFPAGRATSARRRYFIRTGDPFSICVFSLSFYCDTKTSYKNYIQLRKFFNF